MASSIGSFDYVHSCPDTAESTPVKHSEPPLSPQEHSSPLRKKRPPRHVVYDPDLHEKREKAKELEWKLSLQAFLEVSNEGVVIDDEIPDFKTALHGRISRIARSIDLPVDDLVEDLCNTAHTTESIAILLGTYCDDPKLTLEYAGELYREISCSFKEDYVSLQAHVVNLLDFIQESAKYPDGLIECRMKVILIMLRAALRNPAYKLLCCDEGNPCVRVLHALAMSSYIKSETLPAYMQFGQAVYEKSSIHRIHSLGNIFSSMYETAANSGIPEDDRLVNDWYISKLAESLLPESVAVKISKILDVATLVFNCMNANVPMIETWDVMTHHLSAFFVDTYKDYRLIFGNLPGVFYEELFNDGFSLRVLVGSTPASGSVVHPEFLALLQALENRKFERDSDLPFADTTFLAYTNYQKLLGGFEGVQSEALGRLNKRYPHSIEVITLSTDLLSNKEPFDEDIKIKIKMVLREKGLASAVLTDDVLNTIIEKAYDLVPSLHANKVGFFADLVNTGIVRYREAALGLRTMQTDNATEMLCMRICVVCADRAMTVNNEILNALTDNPVQVAKACIGRPVMTKGRLPLDERVTQASVFAHGMSAKLREYYYSLDELATEDALKSQKISYPGCTETEVAPPHTPARKRLFDSCDQTPKPSL